jgi:hypothetical protein
MTYGLVPMAAYWFLSKEYSNGAIWWQLVVRTLCRKGWHDPEGLIDL